MKTKELIYQCKQQVLKQIEDEENAEMERIVANQNEWYKVWEQAKDLLPDEVSNYLNIIVESDFPPSHGSYFQAYLRLPDCLEIMIKFYTNYQTGNVEYMYEILYVEEMTFSELNEAIGYAAIEWEKKEQQAAAMAVAEDLQNQLDEVEKISKDIKEDLLKTRNVAENWIEKLVKCEVLRQMAIHELNFH